MASKQLIGAHVGQENIATLAKERDADIVQLFLGDPQGWKAPVIPDGLEELKASGLPFVVHSPYVINVASPNNKIRIPSRKILGQQSAAAAEVGAIGLVVHGGHVTADSTVEDGFDNWRKTFERGEFPCPIWIENTAGGDHAMARQFDVMARFWDVVGEFNPGFVLDTCHAHAAGEGLLGIVERVKAITGRIDLVHLNGSRDAFGSGRDRHANIHDGFIEPQLLDEVVKTAGAPVVCETPGDGQADDIAWLRSNT